MLTEESSTEGICQAFADQYESPVFVIHTQPSTSLDKSLLYEAEAIKKFVEESGLDEVILVANSQSTKRALRLIESMQEKKTHRTQEKSVRIRGRRIRSEP